MNQRAITRPEWADLRDEMITFEQSKPGLWWVSVGYHPNLGGVTIVEDEQEQVVLLHQNPWAANDPNYRLDEAA